MRKCWIVVAPNILTVKTDHSWETSLARFLILLINNNPTKCLNQMYYQTCVFPNDQFTTDTTSAAHLCSLSLPRSLSVSPLSCLLSPASFQIYKRLFDRMKIINWIDAFVKRTVLISKVTSIQNRATVDSALPSFFFVTLWHFSFVRKFYSTGHAFWRNGGGMKKKRWNGPLGLWYVDADHTQAREY